MELSALFVHESWWSSCLRNVSTVFLFPCVALFEMTLVTRPLRTPAGGDASGRTEQLESLLMLRMLEASALVYMIIDVSWYLLYHVGRSPARSAGKMGATLFRRWWSILAGVGSR